ncbi:methyltransferase domain-containing protein [Catenovulum sp. 2E275]|uniref:L-histidine N(alpha)-methyltransferase n=1 Tax=Catenovulum sp. 2E275 TaxID=2980497 RepID=UPI0021D152A9|nr:methyltransferase domain-containing protein [Catenovulum sp. 2E275]MCU4674470.1 methyltransferase domain-containing protein [Catenovulum sp. 2E275]
MNYLQSHQYAVSSHFSRAANTYDNAAQLQQAVIDDASDRLLAKMKLALASNYQPIQLLDVGCGTSNLLMQLIDKLTSAELKQLNYTGVDIAQGMLDFSCQKFKQVGINANWQQANAESLAFSDNSFDYVFSSLAWQWCDLSKVLNQAHRVLKPGGCLVFTTLLDGTLTELAQAYLALDEQTHINQFMQADEFEFKLGQLNWADCQFNLVKHNTYYSSVYRLLKELKSVGANTITCNQQVQVSQALTKARLAKLETCYPNSALSDNITASWQVAYCCLVKK